MDYGEGHIMLVNCLNNGCLIIISYAATSIDSIESIDSMDYSATMNKNTGRMFITMFLTNETVYSCYLYNTF